MNDKKELLELIENLPEEKLPEAMMLLKSLFEQQSQQLEKQQVDEQGLQGQDISDPLDDFMTIVVNSLTNMMYDLSVDAQRKEEKILAKRLETYRKKMSDGWNVYQINKGK